MTAHALYVTAAYGVSALAIAGLIAWVLLDSRARRREMAELEASGLRRRSDRKGDAVMATEAATPKPRRLWVLLPLLLFLGLAALFLMQLTSGRTAIDWGVYGVPETFLVGRDGKIVFKHVGPLTEQAVTTALLPAMEKALAAN